MSKRSLTDLLRTDPESAPRRSIIEIMLLRPKPQVKTRPKPKKERDRSVSQYYGHHLWMKNFPGAAENNLLEASRGASRLPHIDAMDAFIRLESILKTMDEPWQGGERCILASYLDWTDVRDLHAHNIKERSARHHTRTEAAHLRSLAASQFPKNARVMHRRLHKVLLYASVPAIFHGHTHDIPIIVHSCVEELLKRGIYEPDLFRVLPNSDRLAQLVDIFNDGPSFGDGFSLFSQNIHDVAATLVNFLVNVKDPVISPIFLDPLWYWCVKPSVKRENAARDKQETTEERERTTILRDPVSKQIIPREEFYYVRKPVAWTREEQAANQVREDKQISTAIILLKLLPTANLSLITYLLDFFTRICRSSRNKVEHRNIVRIFGHNFVGGKSKLKAWKIMEWIIERWPRLYAGLFGASKDTGIDRVKVARRGEVNTPTQGSEPMSYDPTLLREGGGRVFDRKSPAQASMDVSKSDGVLQPSDGLFDSDRISRASSESCYSNSDEGDDPPRRVMTFPVTADEHHHASEAQASEMNPPLIEMLKLFREECARNHRLEQKLSARDQELARLLAKVTKSEIGSGVGTARDNVNATYDGNGSAERSKRARQYS